MAQGKYPESISISKIKDMDYKDYSEYNEVDTVNGDDITLQVIEMSDGDKYIGVMNNNEGESEVNRKDFFMLTSDGCCVGMIYTYIVYRVIERKHRKKYEHSGT